MDAWLNGFNARADMFVQAGFYIVTILLALRLKAKLFSGITWSDLIIPLIFTTLFAGETLTSNPFAHGLIPLLAVILCYLHLMKSEIIRVVLIAVFSWIEAFTGFAIARLPVFVFVEMHQMLNNQGKKRWWYLLSIGMGRLPEKTVPIKRANRSFSIKMPCSQIFKR